MLKRFIRLIDAASLVLAFLLARIAAPALHERDGSAGLVLVALPITILALEAARSYTGIHRQSRSRLAWNCIAAPTAGLAAAAIAGFALGVGGWVRALAFAFWGLSVLGLLLSRIALYLVVRWRRANQRYGVGVVIVGHREDVGALIGKSAQRGESDYNLLGYYTVEGEGAGEEGACGRRLGSVHTLAESLIHTPAKLVIVIESSDGGEWLPGVMKTCDYFRLPVQVASATVLRLEEELTDLRPRRFADQLTFAGQIFEPTEFDSDLAAFKRLMDVVVSAVALVCLTPLFLLIAIAIKLTTPRLPVIYRYTQVGLHGEEFTAYKFTTMVRNAEALKHSLASLNEMQGPVFKIKNDPRVTRLGKYLRLFSLNELPQFWNVLKGDLSLVGPRAALPCELAGYKVWHKRKLTVKPGLTCLWQVSGRNRISSFDEWVRLDMKYIDGWSLWLDLKIILRTAWVVVRGTGS